MNDISPESDGAFRARLRHFQRQGFPEGSNTGRGKPAEYNLTMALQLVVAIEFLQAGVAPARIVQLVTRNWSATRLQMLLASYPSGSFVDSDGIEVDPNIALCASPESLRDLTNVGEQKVDYFEAFHFEEVPNLGKAISDPELSPILGVNYRWVIILLHPLMMHFLGALQRVTGIEPGTAIEELREDIERHSAGMKKISDMLEKMLAEPKNGDS